MTLTKVKLRRELKLPQIAQLTQVVSVLHPDAIVLLLQKAIEAAGGKGEWGEDMLYTLEENQDVLNLVYSLQPRDIAEVMLICQFVVLHFKGMKELYKDCDGSGIDFLKLSQETFSLLCRYRGKTAQNINVTYNVLNSSNALLNTDLRQEVVEKSDVSHVKG